MSKKQCYLHFDSIFLNAHFDANIIAILKASYNVLLVIYKYYSNQI